MTTRKAKELARRVLFNCLDRNSPATAVAVTLDCMLEQIQADEQHAIATIYEAAGIMQAVTDEVAAGPGADLTAIIRAHT